MYEPCVIRSANSLRLARSILRLLISLKMAMAETTIANLISGDAGQKRKTYINQVTGTFPSSVLCADWSRARSLA